MKTTNTYGLPKCFTDAVENDKYDLKDPPPNIVSCTTVIAPAKIKVLEKRHDAEITEDVSDKIWRFFGSACHSIIEDASQGERLSEERLYIDMDDGQVFTCGKGVAPEKAPWYHNDHWYVSVKLDVYEASTKALYDFKFTSVWSYIFEKGAKPDWTSQLNIGAYALRQIGFPVESAGIIAVFKDFRNSELKQGKYGNDIPICAKEIPVPLWDDAYALNFMRDRVRLYATAINQLDDLIRECSFEERWERPTTYAVMKEGRKSALRVLDSEEAAQQQVSDMSAQYPKDKYSVQVRPGVCNRCQDYCTVGAAGLCNWWNDHKTTSAEVPVEA